MKNYSSKRSVQLLAHILEQYGVFDFIISPGSRNAPLAIHFAEIDEFNCYSIVDERSAGFVALGLAKAQNRPVALTCTSGSAAANYYPAVTEAFYSNTPLLILTADRPTDYVDIFDGQTIRQNYIFQQHSYGDFQLKEDSAEDADDYNFDVIIKAVELCLEKQGPVHINIPLEEPLYELVSELPALPLVENTIQSKNYILPSNLVAEWNLSKRILILIGSIAPNPELETLLSQLAKNHSVVILTEVTSNVAHEKFFMHIDRYIFNFTDDDYLQYAPDLLITVGQNVVSKKVKQFLRAAKPAHHWHIDPHWHPDTFFVLSESVATDPVSFFMQLVKSAQLQPSPYFNLWDNLKSKRDKKHQQSIPLVPFSDLRFFELLSKSIPENYSVHFSNSSAIRYAQLFDFNKNKFYCNRGTSGIEGCTSTAMGYAMGSHQPTLLVTGDVGFFYDVNGLWNDYIPPYTRIIVFNNHEGNIFKIIPGPKNANSNILDEFIATTHRHSAELIAKHFGFSYVKAKDDITLERVLENFFKPDTQPKLLEVDTSASENADILKDYFRNLV